MNQDAHGSGCAVGAGGGGGQPGQCKLLRDCGWAVEQLRHNSSRPKICSFRGPYPVVCCPSDAVVPLGDRNRRNSSAPSTPSAAPARGVVANRKCAQYAQFVYAEMDSLTLMASTVKVDQCAASADPLIVGGSLAKPMEFPHMALVGYDTTAGIEYTCGGSLISPEFVLTAAHCLSASGGQKARWVLLGELDRSTDTDDAAPQVLEVAERIPHPHYAPPAKYHDIALLKLARAALINGHVRPACLHTDLELVLRTDPDPRESLIATGWGHTEFVGEPSAQLMKVALFPASLDKCNRAFANAPPRELPQGVLAEGQLCAGGAGKDTCQGDSGGPLQMFTRNATGEAPQPYCMYKVVGVTSFGQACGFSAPAIYTRVANYVPWIEREVWSDELPGVTLLNSPHSDTYH